MAEYHSREESGLEPIPEEVPNQPLPTSSDTISNAERRWRTVKKFVKSQTLQLVGLEHSKVVQEHQDALQRSIVVGKILAKRAKDQPYSCDESLYKAIAPHESVSPGTTQSVLRQLSLRPNVQTPVTVSPVKEVATDDIELTTLPPQRTLETSASEAQLRSLRHPLTKSISLPTKTQRSVVDPTKVKPTGRYEAQDIDSSEVKPDWWKIAYLSIQYLKAQRQQQQQQQQQQISRTEDYKPDYTRVKSSFDTDVIVTDASKQLIEPREEVDGELPSSESSEDDEDFFGAEDFDVEFQDGRISRRPLTSLRKEKPPPSYDSLELEKEEAPEIGTGRRKKKKIVSKLQYRPGPYYLGGTTLKFLNFKYKYIDEDDETKQKLAESEKKILKRPFFTYWLMTVHIIILIFSLSVYGFAPYGFDVLTERALVQQSNLAVEVQERNVTRNVWGGPPQEALVTLGATYGPCMRVDYQLQIGLQNDKWREANSSGCCIRKDESGCVQVSSRSRCPELFSDFVFYDTKINTSIYNTNRSVCGTSPLNCITPNPMRDTRWLAENITDWPICTEFQTVDDPHLSCNLTGHPCCVGIQSHCLITTLEHCNFVKGRYHPEAFLCSQVDCLSDICGLLPFAHKNVPDQFYRLLTALFLHAGIIHLFFTLLFHFFILRHVEKYMAWFSTAVVYIGSGIGGNIVSAFFVPYNPEVGPAGGIGGVIAFFFIYILYQAHRLKSAWIEIIKLVIIVVILICCGLFPFVDNFAHIGGFVFGFILSGIFAPYYPPLEAELAFYKNEHNRDYNPKSDWIQITKYVFVGVGIPLVIAMYVLFFVLFYVVQETWDGFSYIECIPFTDTFCLDFTQNIRSRDIFL